MLVKQVNKAPVANAGESQTLNEGSLVTLDASGSSDPDLDTLTYRWTAPAGIFLSSVTALNPTFIAPEVEENTEYEISLIVNDGQLDSEESKVTVFVENVEDTLGEPTRGNTSDGPIMNAIVFFDSNLNEIVDEGEPVTTSNERGDYWLEIPLETYDLNNNAVSYTHLTADE